MALRVAAVIEVMLGLVALASIAVGGLAWAMKAQMRYAAAREVAWREFMSNDHSHHRQDMESIARFMGEQVAVLREVREDLRDIRNRA